MSGKTFRTCYIMNFAHRNKLANYFLLECELARRVLKRAVKIVALRKQNVSGVPGIIWH